MRAKLMQLIIICCLLLTACQSKSTNEEPPEIKVLYSSIYEFKLHYPMVLKKYPNITVIQFAPTLGSSILNGRQNVSSKEEGWDYNAYLKLIEENNPDIVFFPEPFYERLIEDGKLKNIASTNTQNLLDEMNANIANSFQSLGAGQIYAVSNTFNPQGIYYNLDLFQQLGIPVPTDNMSWSDTLQLAQQIAETDPTIIPFISNLHDDAELLMEMGQTQQLLWMDTENMQPQFDSPGWQSIVEQLVKAKQNKSIPSSFPEDIKEQFLSGQVAMILHSYMFADQLLKEETSVNWAVVTEPVDPNEPNITRNMAFNFLNGISNSTEHSEESLEVWSYINGKTIAKMNYLSSYFSFHLPVYDTIIRDLDTHHLSAFYSLKVERVPYDDKLSITQLRAAKKRINHILQQATDSTLTTDDAINMLQEEVTDAVRTAQ